MSAPIPIQESSVASGSRFAFVGSFTTQKRKACGTGIDAYRIDADGSRWRHVQQYDGLTNPSFLIADRAKFVLYAVHGDLDYASAFAIDPDSGRLSLINQVPTDGFNGVHLALDPSGRFLLVANYASGSVAVLPVHPDGRLGSVVFRLDLAGSIGPHRHEQLGPHPHHIVFDPSGRFVLVPDKGLDRVFVLAFDAAAGRLQIASEMAMRPGAGPRHLVFHPHSPLVFLVNELSSSVTTCAWDPSAGTLTPTHVVPALPPTFFGVSAAAAIAITPCGRFVYTTNRGHDSITRFAVDDADGSLGIIGWTSSHGRDPRFMSMTPNGGGLVVANEQGNSIVHFAADVSNGELVAFDERIESASPCTIVFF